MAIFEEKMKEKQISINGIPAIVWGKRSKKVYLFVHGKMSCKEDAREFAEIAQKKGYQTVSFDLPEHGVRKPSFYKCDIFNCIKDTRIVADYVFTKWKEVSLSACSLGAQISLQCFKDEDKSRFAKVLFQSPIIDMNYLINQMFTWFDLSEDILRSRKIVDTPVDTMTIDQFDFYKVNTITKWPFETQILYGAKDNMQTYQIHKAFIDSFGGNIFVSENSEHPFMSPEDESIVKTWFEQNI